MRAEGSKGQKTTTSELAIIEAVRAAVIVSDHGEAKNDNGRVVELMIDDGWCEKGRGTGGERERQCILLLCLLLLVVVVAVSTGTL